MPTQLGWPIREINKNTIHTMKIKMTLLAASAMVSIAGAQAAANHTECETKCKTECSSKSKKGCETECKKESCSDKANITHVNVAGMTCGGCSKKLTKALTAIKGVEVKKVCHKSGCVDVVLSDGATEAQVKQAITKKGFKIVPEKKQKS